MQTMTDEDLASKVSELEAQRLAALDEGERAQDYAESEAAAEKVKKIEFELTRVRGRVADKRAAAIVAGQIKRAALSDEAQASLYDAAVVVEKTLAQLAHDLAGWAKAREQAYGLADDRTRGEMLHFTGRVKACIEQACEVLQPTVKTAFRANPLSSYFRKPKERG